MDNTYTYGRWAGYVEDAKVGALVGIEAKACPPGAHALAVIEREVDQRQAFLLAAEEALEGLQRAARRRWSSTATNPNPY